GGKTSIFSHPVYLFLREFSLQDFRGGSVKPNLTCTPQDDSQYPGMDTKTASDYLPQTNWPTTQLPPGYTCAEPYLFPDINKPDGPATAGIDDLGEILAKMKQRTSRGIRK
ncbi:TPA: hypothetical protein ACM68J_004612, partial [Escherichia coli]